MDAEGKYWKDQWLNAERRCMMLLAMLKEEDRNKIKDVGVKRTKAKRLRRGV